MVFAIKTSGLVVRLVPVGPRLPPAGGGPGYPVVLPGLLPGPLDRPLERPLERSVRGDAVSVRGAISAGKWKIIVGHPLLWKVLPRAAGALIAARARSDDMITSTAMVTR